MTKAEYDTTRRHPVRIIATIIGKWCIWLFCKSVEWRDKVEHKDAIVTGELWLNRLFFYFAKYLYANNVDRFTGENSEVYSVVKTSGGTYLYISNTIMTDGTVSIDVERI